MSPQPPQPRIFHITHVDNLPSIIAAGGLASHAGIGSRGGPAISIGIDDIKRRRLAGLEVRCHPGTHVGEYVPFYFCPRSIMLYVISCANHPALAYRGGQEPIVHVEADLHEVIDWADRIGCRWAFSLSNAGARYTEFRNTADELDELDWEAIANPDFRSPETKERKQAEFLVYGGFPWTLARRIGVHDAAVQRRVLATLAGATHRPSVEIRSDWYY